MDYECSKYGLDGFRGYQLFKKVNGEYKHAEKVREYMKLQPEKLHQKFNE